MVVKHLDEEVGVLLQHAQLGFYLAEAAVHLELLPKPWGRQKKTTSPCHPSIETPKRGERPGKKEGRVGGRDKERKRSVHTCVLRSRTLIRAFDEKGVVSARHKTHTWRGLPATSEQPPSQRACL